MGLVVARLQCAAKASGTRLAAHGRGRQTPETSPTGTLHGLGAADGQPRQQLRAAQLSNNLPHFITPTVVGGRIYVSGGKTIAAFG